MILSQIFKIESWNAHLGEFLSTLDFIVGEFLSTLDLFVGKVRVDW